MLAAAPLAAGLVAVSTAAESVESPAYLRIEAVPLGGTGERGGGLHWAVYLDGPFEAGAEQRLADFVEQQHIEHADVYFNSPGGSLLAGMALGRVLREHGFATDVGRRTADPRRPSDGVCYSACPFAFAGGVRRSLREGSALGVHPAVNRVPVPDQSAFERRVSADARDYLVTMGVSPALYDLMAQVPTAGIRLLTREEAESLRLVQGSADARR